MLLSRQRLKKAGNRGARAWQTNPDHKEESLNEGGSYHISSTALKRPLHIAFIVILKLETIRKLTAELSRF